MSGIVSAIFNEAFPQVKQAENTAQNVAYGVAIWGVIITLELGVLIYLAATRGKR